MHTTLTISFFFIDYFGTKHAFPLSANFLQFYPTCILFIYCSKLASLREHPQLHPLINKFSVHLFSVAHLIQNRPPSSIISIQNGILIQIHEYLQKLSFTIIIYYWGCITSTPYKNVLEGYKCKKICFHFAVISPIKEPFCGEKNT